MPINKRLTAYVIISFILLSSIVPLTEKARAEDEFFDAESLLDAIEFAKQFIDFENIMDPHPFRFIGVWNCNKTMTITDDIDFNLYFSSTLLTQLEFLNYQDSIDISVHYRDESGLIKQVGGANVSMKLEPAPLDEFIQAYQVTLKDINLELEENDDLIFVIEVIHSEKPIKDIIEKRFDTKIKNRIEKIASLMQNTEDPDLESIGIMIEDVLSNLSDLNIGGEEFGALVNVLASSAFYFGSNSYPSRVKFSTEEGDNNTIYFHNEIDDSFASDFMGFSYIKSMNGTAPSVTANYAYPPIAVNLDELTITEVNDEEWVSWLAVWVLYVFEEPASFANRVTYYLHSGGLMDSSKPDASKPQRAELSENPTVWTGASFERNKILKNITADLYVYYPKILTIKKTKISAVLKQDNETIASSEAELDRTTIVEKLKRGADTPTRFYFEDLNDPEIWYNKDLTLEISVSDAPFSLFKSPMISYDSSQYLSKITLSYEETDNIKINNLEDKEVYAGGIIEYTLNIESKYSDTVEVTVEKIDGIGDWNYSVYPTKLKMNEGESKEINVTVESEATDANAYDDGDFIKLAINLSGDTGYTSNITEISVSESAVEYGIEVKNLEDVEIKHGSKGEINFIVKNTNKGFIKDRHSIEVTTEHGWNVSYTEYTAEGEHYLNVSEEKDAKAIVQVPWYTDIKIEKITFNISSEKSGFNYAKLVTINITVGEPNILDNIYQLFENAANTMGLNNISKSYSGWVLIGLIIILVILILLTVWIIRKRKYADLICLERIKEINPDETAVYNITIKNPYNSVLTYEIKTETENNGSKSWDISTDTTQLMLEPENSKEMKLYVKPTDYVKKEDWVEVKVIVKPIDKNKKAELSTVTSIKNAEVDVKMAGVFHWPRIFKKGDRVETSFKLFNRGNISANNISVILYVNGEEKNKVEDITIPRGGHADINIPWIAVKGKNEIYIVVK